MRTFVIRARKGTIRAENVLSSVGNSEHFEIVAHTLANAFFVSNALRPDVEVYMVLDSAPDFPRTLRFYSDNQLSFSGFHEQAMLAAITEALDKGHRVAKGGVLNIKPGVDILGYGFDTLMKTLQETRTVYLLDKKGTDIRQLDLHPEGVFVLSDHIPMPKNSIKGMERKGLVKMNLGPKMLFASHCVVLVHNELDRGAVYCPGDSK